MAAVVFTFPAPTTRIACCRQCGHAIALHSSPANVCPPHQRRLLLKSVPRPRVLKVQPWAVDVEEEVLSR
jgi:hypothetical protein